LSAESRVIRAGPSGLYIYVPAGVVKDSQFPFQPGQRVTVRIDPKQCRLIIEAADETKED